MTPTPPRRAPRRPASRTVAALAVIPLALGPAYLPTTELWADDLGSGEAVREESAAHWLDRDTIAWEGAAADLDLWLYADPEATPKIGPDTGAVELAHAADGLPEDLRQRFPHLADLGAAILPDDLADEELTELLRGGLAIAAFDGDTLVEATGLQTPGVLDDLHAEAADRELGPRWEDGVPRLDLWAPTARSVNVELYAGPDTGEPFAERELTATGDGVWSVAGEAEWKDAYYLFEVEVFVPETGRIEHNTVTDPYSVGLAADGARSALLDLSDPALAPEGWDDLTGPGSEGSSRSRCTSCTCGTSPPPTRPSPKSSGAPTVPSPRTTATACATSPICPRTG